MHRLVLIIVSLAACNVHAEIIDGEDLIDPTRPLFLVDGASDDDVISNLVRTVIPASYDVSFIRASSTSPMAIINNERVSIGDLIGGAEVTAIDRNSVTLMINGAERVVNINSVSIKSAVTIP